MHITHSNDLPSQLFLSKFSFSSMCSCRAVIHMYRFLFRSRWSRSTLVRQYTCIGHFCLFNTCCRRIFVLFLLRFEDMYRLPVFPIHLIHVSFAFVFNTCIRGDVLTLRVINTHVWSCGWVSSSHSLFPHAAFTQAQWMSG